MLQWTDDYLSVLVSSRFEQHEGKMSLVDWKWFRNVTDVVVSCILILNIIFSICFIDLIIQSHFCMIMLINQNY